MTNIYITRHGQTEWNIDKRLQGSSNSELTQLGINQAQWLKAKMKSINIDVIYSSPIKRALITAEIIKDDKAIELLKEDGLKEIAFGLWEGMKMDDIDAHEEYSKELYNLYNNPEEYKSYGGEHPFEVKERVYKTLDKIINNNKEKDILIVSHGMTLKFIISYFIKKDLIDILNDDVYSQASFSHIQLDGDKVEIKMLNDTSHYEEEVVKVGW